MEAEPSQAASPGPAKMLCVPEAHRRSILYGALNSLGAAAGHADQLFLRVVTRGGR
jgi:hypothetical protein